MSQMSQFISAVVPPEAQIGPAWWYIFRRDRLLVRVGENDAQLPFIVGPEALGLKLLRQQYLGTLDGVHCYSAEVDEVEAPEGWSFQGLRRLYGLVEEGLFLVAGTAKQIVDWDRTHLYCGRCGAPTRPMAHERAKQCPHCMLVSYPRISPAVIVLVEREDTLLLARSHRHRGGMYSVLAGFVEPGETLEEAVVREIKEEVGITVKDIHYFGSQPWPFPNSLMLAFTCIYAGGELVLEEEEIEDAGWYRADNLPLIPPPISIARQLIDWFVARHSG